MHLRYRARCLLWDIKRDYEEREYYLLPFLVDSSRAAVDVGGNYGSYAGKLATLTRRVHCFEPNPATAAGLRARMPRSVIIHEAAASNRDGTADIVIPRSLGATRAGAMATIESDNPFAAIPGSERIGIRLVRLDEAIREPVGFIKIDVEGHELATLEGAERILREDRPALLVESSPITHPEAPRHIFDFLAARGYV
ncbi:FkbM family methyltransferase, partial [Paracraurococcus lichenis]